MVARGDDRINSASSKSQKLSERLFLLPLFRARVRCPLEFRFHGQWFREEKKLEASLDVRFHLEGISPSNTNARPQTPNIGVLSFPSPRGVSGSVPSGENTGSSPGKKTETLLASAKTLVRGASLMIQQST